MLEHTTAVYMTVVVYCVDRNPTLRQWHLHRPLWQSLRVKPKGARWS